MNASTIFRGDEMLELTCVLLSSLVGPYFTGGGYVLQG